MHAEPPVKSGSGNLSVATEQIRMLQGSHQSSGTPRFDALYNDNAPHLRLWLLARVHRSNVDDASQEVWTRIAAHYDKGFDGNNFRAWMFEIARNYLASLGRRKQIMTPYDESKPCFIDGGADDPSAEAERREQRQMLSDCLARLGHPRKAVVQARMSGSDYKDFAASLGMTKQQAYSHYFAATKLLQACMHAKLGN
jgi:RNA polymerase sigma factor (sigma-70 family)